MIKGYKDLKVWQLAIDLVDQIYDVTSAFPSDEKFGLSSQIKRSAVSIPSNIAKGSLAEMETQLIIANRRNFISNTVFNKLSETADRIDKMLFSLRNSLKQKV